MHSWKEAKLGDFVTHKKGFAFKSQWFIEAGTPIVKVTDFTESSIDHSNVEHVDEKIAAEKSDYALKEGDSVIQTVGSWPNNPASVVGKAVRVPKELNGSLLNQNAVILRPKIELDSRYLFYLLKSQMFKGFIINTAQGAASQASITLDSIFRFPFYKPELETQKKIAAILSAYDDLIENNKCRIAILEKMAEEIYREWFVRFRFPGYQDAEFEKGIPKGWREDCLGNISNMVMGQSPSSEFYNETGDGLPFHQGVGTYGDRFPISKTYCSVTGRLAKKGDILFSVRAPVGRLNIANEKMIIGRGLAAISHRKGWNSYLFYFLKVAFSNEDIIGNGAIFNSVGKDELKAFKLISPPDLLVERFNALAKDIDGQIETLLRSIRILETTKNMLLPRLLSGKLSVEDLDIKFPPSMVG